MGHADYYKDGDYNAICDVCGWKYKASELRKRWDGFMVCERDWEPRHPQDFVRGVRPDPALRWTRPVPADVFVAFCDLQSSSAVSGLASAGCCVSGRPAPP